MAGLSLCAIFGLCFVSSGCNDSSGVSGVKAGSGGFTAAEKKRMAGGPTAEDKKAMEAYMAKSNAAKAPTGAVGSPAPGGNAPTP
jgi:hypothetical protein